VFTEDSELLVIYAGKKGMPNSLKEGDTSPLAMGCK
jgi:hypothetical protein